MFRPLQSSVVWKRALLLLLGAAAVLCVSDQTIMFETEDAIIIEAADLPDSLRDKRQLFQTLPGAQTTEAPSGWPRGASNNCKTSNNRNGICVTPSVCHWIQTSFGRETNKLDDGLVECTVAITGVRRGEPEFRGVCCPGRDSPPHGATEPAGIFTSRATQTAAPVASSTRWWQTSRTASPTPSSAPWWQTTGRKSTASRPATASTDHPPFITHPWQGTRSTGMPTAATHWWQRPTAVSTQKSTTRGSSSTKWWQTTTRPTTTTSRTTIRPPSSTEWWQTTQKSPLTTAWWQKTTTTKSTPPTSASSPNDAFYSCGTRNFDSDRVVGGVEANKGEFPWIAAMLKRGRHFCGGSLIDRTHILTAAHCVAHMSSYDVSQLLIRLGEHDKSTPFEAEHQTYKVARIVRHKGFSTDTLHDDVALITLTKEVEFADNIRPICLARDNKDFAGSIATVAGWGSLKEGGRQPNVLMKVSIKVWENDDCAATYGRQAPGGIISSMLCAGRAGKDSCSGDSGGPLMTVLGSTVYQIGVVSWGIGCGKADYPGVYSRVTSQMDWIERNRRNY